MSKGKINCCRFIGGKKCFQVTIISELLSFFFFRARRSCSVTADCVPIGERNGIATAMVLPPSGPAGSARNWGSRWLPVNRLRGLDALSSRFCFFLKQAYAPQALPARKCLVFPSQATVHEWTKAHGDRIWSWTHVRHMSRTRAPALILLWGLPNHLPSLQCRLHSDTALAGPQPPHARQSQNTAQAWRDVTTQSSLSLSQIKIWQTAVQPYFTCRICSVWKVFHNDDMCDVLLDISTFHAYIYIYMLYIYMYDNIYIYIYDIYCYDGKTTCLYAMCHAWTGSQSYMITSCYSCILWFFSTPVLV